MARLRGVLLCESRCGRDRSEVVMKSDDRAVLASGPEMRPPSWVLPNMSCSPGYHPDVNITVVASTATVIATAS